MDWGGGAAESRSVVSALLEKGPGQISTGRRERVCARSGARTRKVSVKNVEKQNRPDEPAKKGGASERESITRIFEGLKENKNGSGGKRGLFRKTGSRARVRFFENAREIF